MKKSEAVFFAFILICSACKRNSNNGSNSANEADTTRFFQVNQFINSQIKEVDSTPFFIYKIELSDGRKDSLPITSSYFNQIAQQFLVPDINDTRIKKFYTENIFEDQTTKNFTISYTTTNKELELQNVDILLEEDGKTVKRVFLRKFINYPDSSAIEQLSWKPGESLQVNRSVQKSGNQTSRQTTVVWNPKI